MISSFPGVISQRSSYFHHPCVPCGQIHDQSPPESHQESCIMIDSCAKIAECRYQPREREVGRLLLQNNRLIFANHQLCLNPGFSSKVVNVTVSQNVVIYIYLISIEIRKQLNIINCQIWTDSHLLSHIIKLLITVNWSISHISREESITTRTRHIYSI